MSSNSGYTGPGQLISLVFGNTWLVRIEREGRKTAITVPAKNLRKSSEAYNLRPKSDAPPTPAPRKEQVEEDEYEGLTSTQAKRIKRKQEKKKGKRGS